MVQYGSNAKIWLGVLFFALCAAVSATSLSSGLGIFNARYGRFPNKAILLCSKVSLEGVTNIDVGYLPPFARASFETMIVNAGNEHDIRRHDAARDERHYDGTGDDRRSHRLLAGRRWRQRRHRCSPLIKLVPRHLQSAGCGA